MCEVHHLIKSSGNSGRSLGRGRKQGDTDSFISRKEDRGDNPRSDQCLMRQAHHDRAASRNAHPISTAAGVLVAVLAAAAGLLAAMIHRMGGRHRLRMKFGGEHAGRH